MKRAHIYLFSLALAVFFTCTAIIALPRVAATWATTVSYVLLGPGVQVCRWFLTPAIGTPTLRLWIVAGVNTVIWSLILTFFLGLLPERRRVWREVTLVHVLMALAAGAAASFVANRLNLVAPKWAGVLTIPSTPFEALAAIVSPDGFVQRARLISFVGGMVGYSLVFFVALYRFAWRKSDA